MAQRFVELKVPFRASLIAALLVAGAIAPFRPVLAQASGLAALDRGESAEARPALRANAAEALLLLAIAEQGESRKKVLGQAAEVAAEGSWEASAIAGLTAMEAERSAEAVASYRQALSRHADKRLWQLLGDALRSESNWLEARDAYRKAVELDPEYAVALVAGGDLDRRAGDFAAAYNAYNHALDESGRPLAALLGRAAARLQLGDEIGTKSDLERAGEVATTAAERARAWMAVVYANTYWRTLPAGLDAAERTVALWSAEGRADSAAAVCNATGRVLLETGDIAGAESWYERGWQIISASNLPPEERTLWQVRRLHAGARIAAQRRDFRQAQQIVDEARPLMEADAGNTEHYRLIYPYLMGYIRWQERKYEEAIALLEQGEVDQPFIQYLIGDCFARSRDKTQARAWFEKAQAGSSGLDAQSAIVRPLVAAWLAKNPAGS